MPSSKQHQTSRGRKAFALAICAAVAASSGGFGYSLGTRFGYAAGFDSGYLTGGQSGYETGFATGQMLASAAEGASAAHVSGLIRRGDTGEALAFLEGVVDASLVLYSGFVDRDVSEFDMVDAPSASRRVMRVVARHRSGYPPVSDDPGVLQTIDEVLVALLETN